MATLLHNNRPSLRPSRALSALLADMLREPQAPATQPAPAFVPATDVLETATGFELYLALPGVKKAAVSIEFLDGHFVDSGNRPNPAAAQEAAATATKASAEATGTTLAVVVPEVPAAPTFRRIETSYGHFSRSFRLPNTVNVKAIEAEFIDGILRVALPFDTEKVTKQHIVIR